jgi:tRNA-dihydrouridine synthase B
LTSSLRLGSRTFPVNLIQGPLAGVSCAPFRLLTWRLSQPAFSCTEMISAKTLLHRNKQSNHRFITKDPAEGPVCFQLSGNQPVEIAEAVKIATDAGADLIDVYCGCPVNIIRSKGAGSRLLTNPSLLYELIKSMKMNTHVPVSIKIRVEGGSQDTFNRDVAAAVRDGGADFLVVHGRHWTEHYETPCQHDQIRFFVDELNIPVIGNGDVACLDSLKRMLATGCAGAMIGRAGVGQPWLIGQLMAELRGEPFIPPALREVGQLFIEHVIRLTDLLGNEKFALLQARKFAKYYGRRLPDRAGFCDAVNICETLVTFSGICAAYFV